MYDMFSMIVFAIKETKSTKSTGVLCTETRKLSK